MSREQYRARSKKVQKLGRDGLVEQDKATGREERISQRESDVSFGPNRTPEQGLIQRVPAKGDKRRQRPRPSPPPEPVEPAAPVETEVIPTVRQAEDAPETSTPPPTDSRTADTRRQQKQASRLNPDAPSHFNAKDDGDGGRLQFEPEQTPTADTVSHDDTEPAAPHGADDVPVRERPPGKSARRPSIGKRK